MVQRLNNSTIQRSLVQVYKNPCTPLWWPLEDNSWTFTDYFLYVICAMGIDYYYYILSMQSCMLLHIIMLLLTQSIRTRSIDPLQKEERPK